MMSSAALAFANSTDGKGTRTEAELRADRLDLDAAAGLVRAIVGPQGWPDEDIAPGTRWSHEIASFVNTNDGSSPGVKGHLQTDDVGILLLQD